MLCIEKTTLDILRIEYNFSAFIFSLSHLSILNLPAVVSFSDHHPCVVGGGLYTSSGTRSHLHSCCVERQNHQSSWNRLHGPGPSNFCLSCRQAYGGARLTSLSASHSCAGPPPTATNHPSPSLLLHSIQGITVSNTQIIFSSLPLTPATTIPSNSRYIPFSLFPTTQIIQRPNSHSALLPIAQIFSPLPFPLYRCPNTAKPFHSLPAPLPGNHPTH